MSRIYQIDDNRGFFVEEDTGDFLLGFKHDDGHETHVVVSENVYADLRGAWKIEPMPESTKEIFRRDLFCRSIDGAGEDREL